MHAVIALRESGYLGEIHVFSRDRTAPYNPMLTTYYIAGKLPYEGLFPFGELDVIQQKYGLTLHLGAAVTALNPARMTLTAENLSESHFDDILLATGAQALVPPLGVQPGNRVLCMRTVEDAVLLKRFLEIHQVRSALIVGASMVGIKILELLHDRGVSCTLADLAERVFPLSAFPSVSEKIEQRLREAAVELRLGCGIKQAEESNNSVVSYFEDGSSIQTDLLLLCIGTRAEIGLAKAAGLDVGRGIRTDCHMRTSHPHIYAAGDCAETVNLMSGSSGIIGLWANAAYQGRAAGQAMAELDASFSGNLIHNITHFMGMDFISIGDVNTPGVHTSSTSPDGTRYVEVVRNQGRLCCVNLLDSYSVSGVVRNYMLRRVSGDAEPLPPALRAMLAREGFDDRFLQVFENEEGKND